MFQFPDPTSHDPATFAVLPPAPLAAMAPAFSFDPAVQEIHRQLAALHCAAFVAVTGPPPDYVALEPVTIDPADGRPPQHCIAARLQLRADARSTDWFNAFREGLTTWEEASFADPLSATPADGDQSGEVLDLVMTSYDDALRMACRRMVRIGQIGALRNLVAFCEGQIPSRYDPDHPDYPRFRERY